MQLPHLFPFGFASDPQGLRSCVCMYVAPCSPAQPLQLQACSPEKRLSRIPPRLEQEKETVREVTPVTWWAYKQRRFTRYQIRTWTARDSGGIGIGRYASEGMPMMQLLDKRRWLLGDVLRSLSRVARLLGFAGSDVLFSLSCSCSRGLAVFCFVVQNQTLGPATLLRTRLWSQI